MRHSMKFTHKSAGAILMVWDSEQATLGYLHVKKRRRGHGTEMMEIVCDYADQEDLTIILTAAPFDDIKPGLDEAQLIEFYTKFGFRSRSADYPEDMIRLPGRSQ